MFVDNIIMVIIEKEVVMLFFFPSSEEVVIITTEQSRYRHLHGPVPFLNMPGRKTDL